MPLVPLGSADRFWDAPLFLEPFPSSQAEWICRLYEGHEPAIALSLRHDSTGPSSAPSPDVNLAASPLAASLPLGHFSRDITGERDLCLWHFLAVAKEV